MAEQKQDTNNTSPPPETRRPEYKDRKEFRDERKQRDPLGGLFPGLILIELGILFYAEIRGWVEWTDWWKYFLIGLGAIFLIEAIVRYFVRSYRSDILGRIIPGIILLFIGLAFLYGFSQWWPAILIAAGVIILISLLFRRK
jgi:hypothetical protein